MLPMILKTVMLFNGNPDLPVDIPAESGRISVFGGPSDRFLHPTEPDWTDTFLVSQLGEPCVKDGDPFYIAMRWFKANDPPKAFGPLPNWDIKVWYARQKVAVMHPDRTRLCVCWIADWGPNVKTGRVADLGPLVAAHLAINTDEIAQFSWVARDTPTGPYWLIGKEWVREEASE